MDPTHRQDALFAACARGDHPAVEELVEVGAEAETVDSLSWRPIDHAAYKGHLRIAEYLHNTQQDLQPSAPRLAPATKTTSEYHVAMCHGQSSVIFLRLGSCNTRKPRAPLELNNVTDSSFSTQITVRLIPDNAGQQNSVDLPPRDNDPHPAMTFECMDAEDAKLVFQVSKVHPRIEVVATGVAMLGELRGSVTDQHESLSRDHTIAVIDKETGEFRGSVTFNVLVIKPFKGQQARSTSSVGFWRTAGGATVVGHRGDLHSLRMLVKTLTAFQGYVQLTKDFIPVIYHDFLIKDTGTETPINTLTKDQFLHIGHAQDFRGDLPSAAEIRFKKNVNDTKSRTQKPRSRSLNRFDDARMDDLVERLSKTDYGPTKAVKGNRRGFAIQEPLATLEQLLRDLPQDVAFDLEMKYPMLWEAENQGFEPWAIEVNFFVDTILSMVYALGGSRDITFSSFSPEVCILLAMKQQDYPVLFITKAGNVPTGDIRTSSLEQAVHFAKAWGLAGIVSLIKPLQLCPGLVQYIKQHGLAVAAYGTATDDPETVKMLAKAGLDAIITNRVRLISKALGAEADDQSARSLHEQ
ncbi:MAG: hypothetical protein Q9162_003741 [Coniocarpon cinnabarinum]